MSKHHGWSECTASCGSGANEVDEARGKLIQKCIKDFMLPALNPIMCWSCRAAALADIADSLRRLVEEMPVDAQASFHLQDTPGPWEREGLLVISTRRDAEGVRLSVAECLSAYDSAVEADARLIAAAPDLLAALKAMVEWGPLAESLDVAEFRVDVANARAAIAKAEGPAMKPSDMHAARTTSCCSSSSPGRKPTRRSRRRKR